MPNPNARLCLLLVFSALAFVKTSAASAPNVVLILSDDQAWSDYGFMGHDVIQTPHLDRLAGQSALFTNGYVPSSLCRPSLMTIISGLYPHQHKVVGNDPPRGTSDRNVLLKHIRAVPVLPRMLGELGYQSFQAGKWWEGHWREGGFTAGMSHGDPARGGRHGDAGLKIGREGMEPVFEFIRQCGEKPFFLWYAPMLPHTPHNPPERLFRKYQAPGRSDHVARYYAMCELFDETCGQLLDFLDQQGLADNTLVVYVTDNGWIQNPEGRNFAPKSKRSPYDGGLRTPIMLRWPGKIAPARHETLVSSIDLAPTILAACGLKATPDMPGVNLLDVIAGRGSRRDTLFGEVLEHDIVDIDDPSASLLFRWCRRGKWKVIVPAASEKAVELYDLAADPWETSNLAGSEPEVAGQLVAELKGWWSPGEK